MISPGVAGRNTLNAANEAFTNEVTMKGGQFQANWLGVETQLTNAHAVNHKDIIEKNKKKGKDVKKVRMSLAEKEHIWRVSKKWINDESDIEEKSSESEQIPPQPEI